MKPTTQSIEQSRRYSGEYALKRGSALPITDYSFQPTSMINGGRCFGTRRSSFLTISRGYFENEARRNFVGEAAFFVVMIVTAALPIASSVIALASLMRSFAAL